MTAPLTSEELASILAGFQDSAKNGLYADDGRRVDGGNQWASPDGWTYLDQRTSDDNGNLSGGLTRYETARHNPGGATPTDTFDMNGGYTGPSSIDESSPWWTSPALPFALVAGGFAPALMGSLGGLGTAASSVDGISSSAMDAAGGAAADGGMDLAGVDGASSGLGALSKLIPSNPLSALNTGLSLARTLGGTPQARPFGDFGTAQAQQGDPTPADPAMMAAFGASPLASQDRLYADRSGADPFKGGPSHFAGGGQVHDGAPGPLSLVSGTGGGQDDVVDAALAPGEYVFDADTVSSLGDGNNAEGARKLDQWREELRKHKRAAPVTSIPPRARHPNAYLKGGR